MTTPDYAGLIERLHADVEEQRTMGEPISGTLVEEAATALRTLLESNAALERERDLFKELYAKECHARLVERDRLAERVADATIQKVFLTVGECLAGLPHSDVSPSARGKIEAAITRARSLVKGGGDG